MNLDATGIAFLKKEEASGKPALVAFKNKNDVWTIGYGNTYYENGTKVKQGDTITAQRAETLFYNIFNQFAKQVSSVLKKPVTQNQFNALVSYAYNRGFGAFKASKVLALVNQNPNNIQAIQNQLVLEWGTNQTYKTALINRRKREGVLYATGASSGSYLLPILALAGITFLFINSYSNEQHR